MKKLLTLLLSLAFLAAAQAQMWNGQDTLYGNEWIDYSKTYFRFKIADDGVYRLDFQTLSSAGFPAGNVPASEWRLYRNGQQEAVFTSTNGTFGSADFLEFYGRKNRGELDFHLFENADAEQVNPRYSIFNDSAAYYLSWGTGGQALRYAAAPNDLSNLPPAEPFCWQTTETVFWQGGFAKKSITDDTRYSWFDGLGYVRAYSASTNPVPLLLPKIFAAGPDATAHIRYACNLGAHHQQILLNDSLFAEDEFYNFKIIDRKFPVGAGFLNAPATAIATFKLLSPLADRNGLALASIRYPRLFDFENANVAAFELEASQTEKYLEIKSFDLNAGNAVLWDLTNKTRLETASQAGLAKAKIAASAALREFVLVSPAAVKTVTALQPLQFQNPADGSAADFLIISNKALFADPAAGGTNHVAEYADYRRSLAGGSHAVKVVDVNELYEQFAYGVRYHPIAVRNFLHWAKRAWPQAEHAFIIGKALDFHLVREPAQQNALVDSLYFVPTFSSPGADLPFVMRGNHLSQPILAIGRLAVTKPSEIRDYLDKVILHEQQLSLASQTIGDKAWMKRVIHNSGGLSGETTIIRGYTTSMADVLKNNRFGADVHTFYKTSDDPVQISAYEQLLDLMNNGVAIWSIFGHSSAFTVDFDIGQPGAYSNYGRYPLMLILGCLSGQASLTQPGIGERFVLAPDRGAIAYIASVDYSFPDALHAYGRQYYERLGGADYGKSVGLALANTVDDLKNTQDSKLIAVLHQSLLQGDPAIRVYAHDGPDYVVDNQTVLFDPNPIGLEKATAKLTFDAVNIGENPGGQLALTVEQRLPDNTVLSRVVDTIPAPPNRSKLEYELPLAGSKIGFNRFFISLDPDNQVAESPAAAEGNNDLADASGERGMDVYFYSDDVSPVFPAPYAIVSKPSVTLWASTLNTAAPPLRYLFEMDTLETFDSPFKLKTELTERGGLLSWKPAITLKDSTVYHWRVARDSLVNGAPLWRSRSFVYLPNSSPGWNQSHFGQYRDDVFANMQANDTTRQIEFRDNAAFITVQVAYRGVNRYPGLQNSYYENFLGDYGWNQRDISRGVVLVVANPNTGRLVHNPPGGPFNHNPPEDRVLFWFDTRDSLQRLKLMDFVETGIPNGHYAGLLAFNTPTDAVGYAPHLWAMDSVSQGKNLFQVLESQGAKSVRQTANFTTAPPAYGFVFRKNDPAFPALDSIVNDPTLVVDVRANFPAKWSVGQMETPPIGPVKAWKSLLWRRGAFDDTSDEAALAVLAVRDGQPDSLLFRLTDVFETSLAGLSAAQFPQLKLRYEVADTLARTATPLAYARVLFDAVPEGALHPAAHFTFQRDTLQQGETLRASIAFANISDAAFDSLLVKFRIENQAGTGGEFFQKLKPLAAGDSLHANFSAPTLPFQGPQRLLIEANPANHQPELYHFNNVLLRDFFVGRDERNPLLDVTFDGQHILDGDLVSPKPVIILTLKDENRYLAMTDSSTFALTLVLPDGSQQTLAPNDPALLFFPADASNLQKKNLARLEWRPAFVQDGEYRLLVNGRDASGNESAALDWSVTFKIITKSSLSNVLNYPNPFSTSTCFVYTLTGSEPPTHFKIQIMTVSGRVVREITEQEFGPLKPGTHRSDFCWNGRDEYGDQLANGVYLYRIVAKKVDGSDFDLFENGAADGFFKHGFGKMVLMR
ncbi:MAG: C25 family cysteine peptidase [Saprospiraceae bacterium]